MKDYKQVVFDRFNRESDHQNSIYNVNHPIGKYIRKILYKGLDDFLKSYVRSGRKISELKLLDLGCGSGGMIEYFISRGFEKKNIIGLDLSDIRIEKAKKSIPGITFLTGDLLTFELNNESFDLITSFDLFSHLSTHDQILTGLLKVKEHLKNDGIFLWYDIYSKDHFISNQDADSWGFNIHQFKGFSDEAGFDVIYHKSFFKCFFNKYHSIYQVRRFSSKIVQLLEKILPGMPGNMMVILKKKQI